MSILSSLDGYINESYIFEGYDLAPVDYDKETNVSFVVSDNGKQIAGVKVMKLDGDAVDAVDDQYDYSEVYAEVELDIEGDEDNYDKDNVMKWVVPKLMSMGYGDSKIVFDGEEVDLSGFEASTEEPEEDEVDDIKDQISDIEGDDSFSIDDLESDDEEEDEE